MPETPAQRLARLRAERAKRLLGRARMAGQVRRGAAPADVTVARTQRKLSKLLIPEPVTPQAGPVQRAPVSPEVQQLLQDQSSSEARERRQAERTARGLTGTTLGVSNVLLRGLGRDLGARTILQGAVKAADLIGKPLGLEAHPALRS
ncbi:MAG: hypothetical protein OER89_08910, partial [Gemmatimonadota bacterium]|nr:hypothetical protein [Gemmatimonadota bacterium]